MYYDCYTSNPYARGSMNSSLATGALAGGLIGFVFSFLAACWLIILALAILKYVGEWKMFKKAGIDGWESLVPGHNVFVQFQMAGIKTYWYFLLFVPIANIVVLIWKDIELAKAYGKSTAFGIGLFFLSPIFVSILGFGNAKYVGSRSSSDFCSSSNESSTTKNNSVDTNSDNINNDSNK